MRRACARAPSPGIFLLAGAQLAARTQPALRTHFNALRLFALREGDMIKETLGTGSERECLYAHLRTYTNPMQLFAAGEQLTAHS